MLRYEFFKLDVAGILIRYYLLMAVVIIAGFSGQWWVGLLALPIFISAITGMKISFSKKKTNIFAAKKEGRIIKLPAIKKQEAS